MDTKSNPVDGLSRGDMRGPWLQVERGYLPNELFTLMAEEVKALAVGSKDPTFPPGDLSGPPGVF